VVYRNAMEGAALSGVPAAAAEAARSTLGSAVAVAAELPGASGAALLDTSRDAYAQAFQVTAGISAALVLGTAFLAAFMLRQARAGSPAGSAP
jgi:DHA2 family multidrug resistance protein-like MFS transporter